MDRSAMRKEDGNEKETRKKRKEKFGKNLRVPSKRSDCSTLEVDEYETNERKTNGKSQSATTIAFNVKYCITP